MKTFYTVLSAVAFVALLSPFLVGLVKAVAM